MKERPASPIIFGILACLVVAWFVVSQMNRRDPLSGGNGTEFGSGGAGLGAADGRPAMPGCDGGTNPASNGKFYIPWTDQECNPSPEDRMKVSAK